MMYVFILVSVYYDMYTTISLDDSYLTVLTVSDRGCGQIIKTHEQT